MSASPSSRDIERRINALPQVGQLFSSVTSDSQSVTASVPVMGSAIQLLCLRDEDLWDVVAVGCDTHSTRWLRESLVAHARIVAGLDGERLVFGQSKSIKQVVRMVEEAARLILGVRRAEEAGLYPEEQFQACQWWTGVSNFGDVIGPRLVHRFTGKVPIQYTRPGVAGRRLASVGSILQFVRHDDVDVWGAGLIAPPDQKTVDTLRSLRGLRVHAVRGKETRHALREFVGLDVPEVYGDPALLLPRWWKRPSKRHGKIAVVPHYVHFDAISNGHPRALVVDVRNDLNDVVKQIAGARAVISSSLHGLIVAQAYGVPWVWLNVTDQQLTGGDFKFRDFFSCLDPSTAPAKANIDRSGLGSLNTDELAAMAILPALDIDLDALQDAFPYVQTGSKSPMPRLAPELPALRHWRQAASALVLGGDQVRLKLTRQVKDALRPTYRAARRGAGRLRRTLKGN